MVEDPETADIILVSGNGMFSGDGIDLIERYRGTRRIILVGPETAAVASLLEMEHWCPFGR